MKNELWKKIDEIVFEALQLEGEKRQEYVSRKCGNSPELLAEVESLLKNEDLIDDFFESPVISKYAEFFSEDAKQESSVGKTIGKYRVLREIGVGGMGAVFLAERIEGTYKRKVALKVIRQHLFDSTLEERFLREQQILASLSHPNIAKLFDGGFSENGEPFIAMEYVKGKPILDFVANKNCTTQARLKLFLKICSAVAYAHHNLIIHRDIKPSNILVTEEGEPILLDFGIAKVLETGEFDESETQTKFLALTPAYASPEQIQNKPVSTASDVYSLGVFLYELLTGNLPFSRDQKSLSELIERISKSTPVKPSENIVSSDQSIKKALNKNLRGDLDTIILKALRKSPERRYQTVEELSEDINRHLDELPIKARPAKFSYRAKKFYQRNKISVLAGVLVFISLLAGIIVSIWQANIANEQSRIALNAQIKAEAETRKAKSEEEKAKKIAKFMEKFMSYANSAHYAEGARTKGEAKVKDVLIEMSDKIEREFPNHLDIQAELHHKLTEIFGDVKSNTKNKKDINAMGARIKFHARKALELRKKVYGERHELIAKDLYYLWASTSDDTDAKMLNEAIQMMRETGPENLNLPYMLVAYANRLSGDQVDVSGKKSKKIHPFYSDAISLKTEANRYQVAEQYYRESLPIYRKYYDENNYAIVSVKCYLARELAKQKKFIEASKYRQICLKAIGTFEYKALNDAVKSKLIVIDRALLEAKNINAK